MSKIKLVSDTIDKNDITALIEWLSQEEIPKLTKGDLTLQLEEKWARKINTKYSVFVNSGSSAILLTLAALSQLDGRNHKIVVPALSWITDVSSPIQLGMQPFLCDCNLNDLSCDLDHLEQLFKQHSPKYFILVSPLGFVPDMARVLDICNKYKVELIEDVCESMGSEYMSKKLGSFGRASVFSTYFGHHISTIEGGFINTNDEELYYMLLSLRSHGWDRDLPQHIKDKLKEKWNTSEFDSLYTFYYPGFNLRSTDLQAFLGLRAIDKLDDYSQKRFYNFTKYRELINVNELKLSTDDSTFISNFAYPVLNRNRNKIIKALNDIGVETRPLIAGSMGNKPFWIDLFGQTILKNSDLIDKYGFYLPNHQDLTVSEIEIISDIVNVHG